MRVLHVIPSLSSVHGGPTRALALMEEALTRQGIEVETATTDDDGPRRRKSRPCGTAVREGTATRRYFTKRLDFYKVSPAFARWIRREVGSYDLVHIHALFSFVAPVAAAAARSAGVPYVIRPLGTLNRYGMEHRRPFLKQLSMKLLDGPALRHAAAVHFTSEAEAEEARRTGIAFRAAVIPLAVSPTEVSSASREPAGEELLYLSRLDPKKNLESLLGGLCELPPTVRLTVVGSGEAGYERSLKERARALGVDGRVHWAGHLEGQAKADAFARANVFVLPSFSENFGIAAAEALAAGLPCVLGRGVAIAPQVHDAGAGVMAGTSPQEIASALKQVLASSARDSMSVRAAALAREHFSLDAMGSQLHKLYEGILEARGGLPR